MANVDHLFLLEFMVNNVELSCEFGGCIAVQHDRNPLRVRVKFLDFPCFEINQTDFCNYQEEFQFSSIDFSTGKSCLFPMHPYDLIRAAQHFPLLVTVFEVGSGDESPPKIIGITRIKLTQSIIDSIKNASVCPHLCPLSEVIKDTFLLKSLKDSDAGFITAFLRLSCFGQSIVTKFKLKEDNESFLFKNSKEDSEFQCKTCSTANAVDNKYKYDVIPLDPMISTDENIFENTFSTLPQSNTGHVAWGSLQSQICRSKPAISKMIQTAAATSPSAMTNDLKCSAYTPFPMSSGGRERCRCLKDISRPLPGTTNRKCSCIDCPGRIEKPQDLKSINPMVRYDTTGALSPAFQGHPYFQNPPVRYNTTSCLSPAFNGALPPEGMLMNNMVKPNPPVRYDTTGYLTSAYLTSYYKTKKEMKDSSIKIPTLYSHEDDQVSVSEASSLTVKKKKFKQRKPKDYKLLAEKRKKKMLEIFDPFYEFNMEYPGTLLGHKECVLNRRRVPATMGWLWRTTNIGRGWRPGAVPKSVSSIIEAHRLASGRVPLETRRKKRKRDGKSGLLSEKTPPTLHFTKKDGAYNISVNALKSGKAEEQPIQFSVPKLPKDEDEGSTSPDDSELDVQFRAPIFFRTKYKAPRKYFVQSVQCTDAGFTPGDKRKSDIEEEPSTPSAVSSIISVKVKKGNKSIVKGKKGKKGEKKKK